MNAPDRQVGGVFVDSSSLRPFEAWKALGYIALGAHRFGTGEAAWVRDPLGVVSILKE